MNNIDQVVNNLSNFYAIKVIRAFGNVDPASKVIEETAKALKEIYRYFEPAFFKGDFYLCKSFDDTLCFPEKDGFLLYDKSVLLNRSSGTIIIQTLTENSAFYLWEDQDAQKVISRNDVLVYHFKDNRECFYARQNKIDFTMYPAGSMFATQFNDLIQALNEYATTKIYYSSCKHFKQSWSDTNNIFFRGGGKGSKIPEQYMQLSLAEFLSTYLARGISMETSREHNLVGDSKGPKPVDIKMHWRDANRTALIEIKFMGTIKKESDGEIYDYKDEKANKGLGQLKNYLDLAHQDSPKTIIKSYLVVIDGRRHNVTQHMTSISTSDGMHYKDIDIVVEEKNKFHETIEGFEKPMRMFAAPKCT